MRRRTVLASLGSTALAGCSTLSLRSSPDPPSIDESTVSVLRRRCETSPDEAAVTFDRDGDHVTVNGTLAVPSADAELFVRVVDGTGIEDRAVDDIEVRIDYGPSESDRNADSGDCAGAIEYEASIALSRPPGSVVVRHVTETEEGYVLKTVATASP